MEKFIAALLGSVLFIAIRLKMEKQKDDDNPRYHFRFKEYFNKEWDDWGLSLLVGLILAFFQESIWLGYASWQKMGPEWAKEFYASAEYGIAGAMGLFGSILIMVLFKFIIRKANKLAE